MLTNTVIDCFKKNVALNPNKQAVVDHDEIMTYSDLDYKSSKVAAYLQARNIGRGDLVLVQAERSIELIIALLAVIKRGAAYVPMDRRLPQKRKEYMAEQCAASLMLSTNRKDKTPLLSCEVVTIEEILKECCDMAFQPSNAHPEDAMYVIFTSGTTGKPKGVIIEHHSVLELMQQHNVNLEVTTFSRTVLMAAVGFDLCQSEIWSALIAGGSIYVLDEDSLLNGDDFLAFCVTNQITHAFVPTLKIYDVLNTRQPEGLKLQYIYTCGEKLHPVEVDHLSYTLVDCYGPTETTIFVTSKVVESKRLNRPASIGLPIGSCKIYILGEGLDELAVGEVGELCISGNCLARGYLGDPGLTAQRFVYAPLLGCRIYRSGDQARILSDGSIQFLGRIDGQIKVRGYRVELGEIESRLLKESEVNSVAVVVEDSGNQVDKRLVAFVVPRNQQHADHLIAKLRRSLESDLPEYMLPEKYFCLEHLPFNSNGKVDKHALLEYLENAPTASLHLERFTDDYQKALASIWFQLLGHGNFWPEDKFFDVGGHSLKAAEMAKAISEHFHMKVSVRDIYENIVFRDLASVLYQRTDIKSAVSDNRVAGQFEKDVTLRDGFEVIGDLSCVQLTDPQNIFLTGATGFVGIHLLEQLLATSAAFIHCPVRCESPGAGLSRLQQVSERYKIIIRDDDWHRILVYTCNLPEPYLGMNEVSYFSLAETVDLVYHSASEVNFIMPYSYMKKTNVEGLREVIDFCTAGKVKPLMLMSTISIYSWGHRYTGKARAYEEDSIDENLPAIRADLGYVQSKWVMEKIADLAASKGLPLMTFRLGYATCHSQTGVSASYQWWGRFIKTCLSYNAVPDLQNMREGLTTVDYMVKAVAFISRKPPALGKKFNLCQSDSTNLGLKAFCERVGHYYGRALPVIPFKNWVALWETNTESPLYPLLGLFKEDMHEGESILELYQNNYSWDCSNVGRFLEGSGVSESVFDKEVLGSYLGQL